MQWSCKNYKRCSHKLHNRYYKKQFKNYESSKANKLNFQTKSSAEDEENKDVICFHCKKNGQIKPICPLLKKNKGQYERYKKAFKAKTWSDSEGEESEQ